MTLTARAVEAAKPLDRAYKLTDEHGLYLFVAPTGLKSWRANFARHGKQQTRTYGRWPTMSLAAARLAHAQARDESVVVAERGMTVRELLADWLKIKLPTLSNSKHRIQVARTLEGALLPPLGDKPIAAVTRSELVALVRACAARGTRETAERLAGRIGMLFDHAVDLGELEMHPAALLARVLPAAPEVRHMASVAPHETGELLRAIDTYPDAVTRAGLKLAAHTFVRVGELLGMRWAELVLDDAIWVVPSERMKGMVNKKRPHVVPLSRQSLAILEGLRDHTGHCDLVLASPVKTGSPLSENTLLFALYRLGYRGRMTVHGFRSLASTVLNASGEFRPDVIERQLAHSERDAVRAAYHRAQYLDERRAMMQWWADWLESSQPRT